MTIAGWKKYVYSLIAKELSLITRYYDRVLQWMPRPDDSGLLLDALDCPQKKVIKDTDPFPDCSKDHTTRTAVLLNGTINHHYDIQGLLLQIAPRLSRTSRILIVAYNPYFSWLYRLANRIGIRKGEEPTTFVTRVDLENIAQLAGYDIVRTHLEVYVPWKLFGIGTLLNHVLSAIPVVRWLGLVYLAVLRPVIPEASAVRPSLSCVVPARNERGNIENCIRRLPDLGCDLEVIFVEGHSSDGTWEEILRIKDVYGARYTIKAFQQTGKGKSDAVRLGFSQATGDLLTILDADLTMPPELLGRFYTAYCQGHADFINGSRLVYPMEGNAMRFLNRLGNVFFAKALSWVLDTQIGDSLCGTKLLARHDYQRMVSWRRDFGDFDPFGDFELIFPAAVLGLGIIDIPIRYQDRTYGSTNISRFRHGLMLLKMTCIGLYRIKLGIARGVPQRT
ncbi:MAG: glycosyltransferase family 2 protein [Nitrospirae bacterium]|nr:glycosyltransferase family 2 protein [Nitrospirota bacterium]NTW64770.1 glycosyltransferase family 2 protein [Nitrospirota bacterium]